MAIRARPISFRVATALALGAVALTNARAQEHDLASLVAQVDPSVVTISPDNQSQGSGFVVDASGLILTNYHVIEGAKSATVSFPDKRAAYVDGFVAIDPSRDLALLHITMGVQNPILGMRSKRANSPALGHGPPMFGAAPIPESDLFNGAFPNGRTPDRRSPDAFDTFNIPPSVQKSLDAKSAAVAKSLVSLHLAQATPAKGERVFAFGSPIGLSGSVSDGIVACIRPGAEVSQTLLKLTHRDIYNKTLGYALDAEWIQTTAPISPGNSGGPLVNARGEVVGINTWVCAVGQNLNFSLSVSHLRRFLTNAGKNLQPLASLPTPRPDREHQGDLKKSLAFWIQLNKFKIDLNDKVAALEKKLQQIVPIDPRNLSKGENSRNRRRSVTCEQMAKAYSEYAGNVKSLDNIDIDPDIILLGVIEADTAQRMGDTYQALSAAAINQAFHDQFWADRQLADSKNAITKLRTSRDLLRIVLGHRYDKSFPSLEETARSLNAGAADAKPKDDVASRDDVADVDSNPLQDASDSADKDALAVSRVWTDRTGRHQVQAKYRGLESGKVKLEKSDGTVIRVALATLSEADQRFIGVVP